MRKDHASPETESKYIQQWLMNGHFLPGFVQRERLLELDLLFNQQQFHSTVWQNVLMTLFAIILTVLYGVYLFVIY